MSDLSVSATSSDEALNEALRKWPPLLQAVQQEATAAYNEIRKIGDLGATGIPLFWAQTLTAMAGAAPVPERHGGQLPRPVKQLRIALDARDLLQAIAADMRTLSVADFIALRHPERASRACNLRQVTRETMGRYPGMAALLDRQDHEAVKAEERASAERARQADAAAARVAAGRVAAAIALISRLAAAGVILTASKKGISASAVALLTAADREAVGDLRAELLNLLNTPKELIA